jgi:hypothetical protein
VSKLHLRASDSYLCVGVDCQHVVDESASRRFKDSFKAIIQLLQRFEPLIAVLDSEYSCAFFDAGDWCWRISEVKTRRYA